MNNLCQYIYIDSVEKYLNSLLFFNILWRYCYFLIFHEIYLNLLYFWYFIDPCFQNPFTCALLKPFDGTWACRLKIILIYIFCMIYACYIRVEITLIYISDLLLNNFFYVLYVFYICALHWYYLLHLLLPYYLHLYRFFYASRIELISYRHYQRARDGLHSLPNFGQVSSYQIPYVWEPYWGLFSISFSRWDHPLHYPFKVGVPLSS